MLEPGKNAKSNYTGISCLDTGVRGLGLSQNRPFLAAIPTSVEMLKECQLGELLTCPRQTRWGTNLLERTPMWTRCTSRLRVPFPAGAETEYVDAWFHIAEGRCPKGNLPKLGEGCKLKRHYLDIHRALGNPHTDLVKAWIAYGWNA